MTSRFATRRAARPSRTVNASPRRPVWVGISAAGIAGRTVGGQIVAISVPAPTDRFLANEQRIVDALHAAANTPVWR